LALFVPISAVAGGGVSKAGRLRLPTSLMVALLHRKHTFNESDEDVIQPLGETPTYHFFSRFSDNPYDGHTMREQIVQCADLLQGLGFNPKGVLQPGLQRHRQVQSGH
jgi:hypothetical protein